MLVAGNLHFNGVGTFNRLALMASDFPPNPQAGELLFKDKRVYICVEVSNGLPFWVQLTSELNTVRFDITTPALEWNLQHNLNTNIVLIQIYDANGKQIIPEEVDASNVDSTLVKFNTPTAGIAIIALGDTLGMAKQNIAFVQDFVNLDTWVVTHNLGFNPAITCIVNNYVVQPESIVHDSIMQATITFASSVSGSVRCV